MKTSLRPALLLLFTAFTTCCTGVAAAQHLDVGAKPISGAEMILDGSRQMLDEKWTYWEGPRFGSALPIKWKIVRSKS